MLVALLLACAATQDAPDARASCAMDGEWSADFDGYTGRIRVTRGTARLLGKTARDLPLTRIGARVTIGTDPCSITAGAQRCTEVTCQGSAVPNRWWR
jgi:hypothetical protein